MSKLQKPSTSKGAIPKTSTKTSKSQKSKKKETVEWQLPSFSVAPKKDEKAEINWEKLKRDTARRQSPEGEDIKEIRRILKEVKDVDVPVHEFLTMISPYTSDNGDVMRSVMAEDLKSFQKLSKKVYETMTQDVSDVLVNEQLQMQQYYDEKNSQLTDKMMRAINEVYEMAPTFDFEEYLKGPEVYLTKMFPLPKKADMLLGDEAIELMRRQQAFHRLQWLRSEGRRMAEENKKLQQRLEELKKEQKDEQILAAKRAKEAEAMRQELAKEEQDMKETLDYLNESIEKSFIRTEMQSTREHNVTAMIPPEPDEDESSRPVSTGAIPKVRKVKKKPREPQWSAATAAEIEDWGVKEKMAQETTKRPSKPATNIKKLRDARMRSAQAPSTPEDFVSFGKSKQQKAAKPPSPFHYSPPKTPPEEWPSAGHVKAPRVYKERSPPREFGSFRKSKQEKEAQKPAAKPPSPFHYSPPKTPPDVWPTTRPVKAPRVYQEPPTPAAAEASFRGFGKPRPPPPPKQTSPFHFSPPKSPSEWSPPARRQETNIQESSTVVQVKRQGMAPRDSWGGFY